MSFDKHNTFKNLLKDKFENGEIIILDKIVEESKGIAKGVILAELDFIRKSKKIFNTSELLPSRKFFNLLENQFCYKTTMKLKGIDDVAFEIEKPNYLKSLDANLIPYAISIKSNNPIIVTEETKLANDNKIFKKIQQLFRS